MSCPLDTAAAPVAAPAHGWTPERKTLFLDRLAAHGNARAACRAVGLSPEAAYRLRRRDPLFARAWAAAILLARENGTQVLAERAIEGIEEQIYYRGELVGTRRRYDTRLLLAHLARLDQLADEQGAGEDAGRFDELVACVAAGATLVPQPDRASFAEAAAKNAAEEFRRREEDIFYAGQDDDDYGLVASKEESEFLDYLEEECAEQADRASAKAEQTWDRIRAENFAAVDALLDAPSPAPDQPPELLAFAAAPQPRKECASLLRTLSTASTTALVTALAVPPASAPDALANPRAPAAVKTPPRTPGGNIPLPAGAASGRREPGKKAQARRRR